MTCVAAFLNKNGSITMGADSAGTAGWTRRIRKDPKVFIKGEMIFGFCGSFRLGNLIRYELKIPVHPKKTDPFGYMVQEFVPALRKCLKDAGFTTVSDNEESISGSFLVGYRGRIFCIESDFQVGESHESFEAVGSGEDLAMGSMHSTRNIKMSSRKRVLMALEAAAAYNAGVAAPFNILQLNPKQA